MAELTMKASKSFLKSGAAQKLLALGALILMFLFFSIASPVFLTQNNIISILLATAVNGVLAVGVTFVIITGGIDLSIGTGMTFASVMTGVFVTNLGFPVWVGILVGLLTGALIGFINGLCVAKLKIPAFIATLGMMMITKGLSLIMSDAKPIYFIDIPHFSDISTGKWFGIPMAIFIFFAAAFMANIILNKTIIGRYDFAIGSNMQATRLSGINTDRWLIINHTMAGLFVGLAGVLMAARLNSAQPALGQGYELDAIAAVVIGGTSLNGGKGTITGTVIGAFIMSTLLNGLRIMSVPQEWQTVLTGIIVIAAVFVHDQTSRTGIDRRDGFIERMEDKYPNITIVDVQYGDGDHLKSTEIAKIMLAAHPNIKGFFGANEGSIIGVLNALKELGMVGDIVTIGYDAGKQQKDAVRDGVETGAITQDPVGIGYKAVEAAVKAIRGEEVEALIDTGFHWYDSSNVDSEEMQPLLYD